MAGTRFPATSKFASLDAVLSGAEMRIGLFAVGRLKTGPEKDLAARYLDRLAKAGPAIGMEFTRVTEVAESRASNGETRKREEAAMLLKTIADGSVLILLDERGKAMDSEAFAALLGNYRDQGKRDVTIAIGGADGLDPALHDEADATICLGKMTWPHQVVRILIAEQLYRAVTILSGHPYHRV
jgi:23S rRNA (pseudouridine1915-N3)-methyltransferase